MSTITITMHTKSISWSVWTNGVKTHSGSDSLSLVGGDYDTLLSNVVNHCHEVCKIKGDIDFIFRKT